VKAVIETLLNPVFSFCPKHLTSSTNMLSSPTALSYFILYIPSFNSSSEKRLVKVGSERGTLRSIFDLTFTRCVVLPFNTSWCATWLAVAFVCSLLVVWSLPSLQMRFQALRLHFLIPSVSTRLCQDCCFWCEIADSRESPASTVHPSKGSFSKSCWYST